VKPGHPAVAASTDPARLHLVTDRVVLRPLRRDDLDELALLLGDAEGLTEWGPALSREESAHPATRPGRTVN
jgi:RimJ/RimL family protein N-acetyltransferase